MTDPENRLTEAFRLFDKSNEQDPNTEVINGQSMPKEVVYAKRMTDCLNTVAPNASEALQLAARCQHIQRWVIPRKNYPMDIQGYNKWRNTLKKHHSQVAGEILQQVGYNSETIERVQFLVQKRQLKIDPEVQLLEDVICLVFIKYYFLDFARQHPEEKVIDIVQKTWRKITPAGQELALQLQLPEDALTIIQKALFPTTDTE